MQDRFKFRVWDNSEKRMIVDEQDFIPVKITNKGILRLSPFNNGLYSIIEFADRFILEQCTGKKDKSGVLAFEGDICKCYGGVGANGAIRREYLYPLPIEYDDYNCCFVFVDKDNKLNLPISRFETFEIIGNIHDKEDTPCNA